MTPPLPRWPALLVLAACNGPADGTDTGDTDGADDPTDPAWRPSCASTLTVGEVTTDVCANAAIEPTAGVPSDAAHADLRIVLGTGPECLVRVQVDDLCDAGRYWIDGGTTVDVRVMGCGEGPAGAATSGSLLLTDARLAIVGGKLRATLAGELNVRVDQDLVTGAVDLRAEADLPELPEAFTACADAVDTIARDDADLLPGLDVLVVLDDSNGMQAELGRLSTAFPALLTRVEETNPDWHLAVLSMDTRGATAGRLRADDGGARTLDSATADANASFAEMADPSFGNYDPTGRRAVQGALTPPLLDGDNAGFYRPDANLATLFVSDTNDQSGDTPELQAFSQWLAALKPPYGLTNQVFSIVAPFGGCEDAEQGGEYSTLTALTRGTFTNICTGDYATALETLAPRVLRRDVRLDVAPVLASVRVVLEPEGGTPTDLERGVQWTWEDPYVVIERDVLPADAPFTLTVSHARAR